MTPIGQEESAVGLHSTVKHVHNSVLTFFYCVIMSTTVSVYRTGGHAYRMAVQMTMVGGLFASARKRSHSDAIQTIKYLLRLIVGLEGLEHSGLLLSNGEKRDPSTHLTMRIVYWAVLERISVSA
jgi:hypothetical protein